MHESIPRGGTPCRSQFQTSIAARPLSKAGEVLTIRPQIRLYSIGWPETPRKHHASVEDPFGRCQALLEDRVRQVQARPVEDAPHPHLEGHQDQAPPRRRGLDLEGGHPEDCTDASLRLSLGREHPKFSSQAVLNQNKGPAKAFRPLGFAKQTPPRLGVA